MDRCQIEKKYPELTGFSTDTQMRILERAKQETSSLKYRLLWLSRAIAAGMVAGIAAGICYSLIQRLTALPSGLAIPAVSGIVAGVVCSLCYGRILRQKVKELVQEEK